MRRETFKKSFLLCCIVVFALIAQVSWSGNDDESYIIGLRYPNSYDIKTYQPWPEIREVSYKVSLSFPSNDVVRFYDGKLINLGWLPFVQPNYPKNDRKWDHFIDGTVKGHPIVHRLYAYWVNKDRNRMVFVCLRYHSIYVSNLAMLYAGNPIPNNNIQKVILQVTPFDILPPPEPGKVD